MQAFPKGNAAVVSMTLTQPSLEWALRHRELQKA